jgi:hypothetical protein
MEEVLPYVTYCSQEFKEKRKESAFFIEIAKALTSGAFDTRDKIGVQGPRYKGHGAGRTAHSARFGSVPIGFPVYLVP